MSTITAKPTFRGGIHPPDNKLTRDEPIEKITPQRSLIIPLSQHIGAPASPVVEQGDQVKKGQKIGEAQGFVSSPVHAPTSGEIAEISSFPHPSGSKVRGIKIEPDGKDASIEFAERAPDKLSEDEVLKAIQEAGIVGMGGAAFPTHVKLSPPEDKEIDTLIINGAECEPYLTADYRLMLEDPEVLVKGTQLVADLLGVNKVYFGIEDNKHEAAEAMEASSEGVIKVVELQTKYPQGWEKTLIKALTGREVPLGGLPLDIGVVVQNVGTIKAIWDAVRHGKPLIERVVTATGGMSHPGNYRLPIGTTWKDLLSQLGGFSGKNPVKLIDGGPMMGDTQPNRESPVIKSTSGVLVLDEETAVKRDPSPCIRCGKCVDVCPAGLLPTSIYKSVKSGDVEQARELDATACCECGSCTYVCPSEIPLVQWIVQGKGEINQLEEEED